MMENAALFCLKSNGFKDKLSAAWQRLRYDSLFCDVTLACEDKQISAHKAILSANSPVLNNLLAKNPHPHPLIYLRKVKHEELVAMLDFMYFGEVAIPQDQLNGLLLVAEDIGITDLKISSKKEDEHIKESKIEDSKNNYDIESKFKPSQREKYEEAVPNTVSNLANSLEEVIEIDNGNKEDESNYKESFEIEYKEAYENKFKIYNENENKEDLVYFCNDCDYIVKNKQHLNRHIELRHNLDSFSCDKCDYNSTSKSKLKVHIYTIHKAPSTEPTETDNCCNTVKKLIWKRYTKVTNDIGESANLGMCNFCGTRLKTSNETGLERHLQSKHFKEFKTYLAQKKDIISKKGSKQKNPNILNNLQSSLPRPLEEPLSDTMKLVSDENINDDFKESIANDNKEQSESNLNERINDKDKQAVVYFCKECDFIVRNKEQLDDHIRTRHNLICFPCDECNFTSTSKSALQVHINAKHKAPSTEPMEVGDCLETVKSIIWKRYTKVENDYERDASGFSPLAKCNFCGDFRRASNETGLERHIESKHREEFKHLAAEKQELRAQKAAKTKISQMTWSQMYNQIV